MLRTLIVPIKDIEAGIVLVFDAPGTNIRPADNYFYYFDTPTILPKTPAPTINFDPDSASYSMIGNRNFAPKIAVSIKSSHSSECQILFRLRIKDARGVILYTDYILVSAIPVSSFQLDGTLLSSSIPGNIGTNGGSILTTTSNNTTNNISVGMTVTGPGIPTNNIVTIAYIEPVSNRYELSQLIQRDTNATGTYTFTRQISCVTPETILSREGISSYIILNKDNNWTYSYNDKIIVKFIREDIIDDTIVIFLPTKNPNILPDNESPSYLPQSPFIKIGGRVIGDSLCCKQLLFE